MSKKSVAWKTARKEILSDPAIREHYEAEVRAEHLREQLAKWRESAGMTSAQVAEALGVSPSAVSRTERRADKATVETLARYARACGVENPQISL